MLKELCETLALRTNILEKNVSSSEGGFGRIVWIGVLYKVCIFYVNHKSRMADTTGYCLT
jgi:hypothetical protein